MYLAQNNSELNPFLRDRFGYTVLSHTDLSRDSGRVDGVNLAALNWGNFDLIVIDESHNFRNNTPGKKDEEGNIIKKSRYDADEGRDFIWREDQGHVASATPVNNDLRICVTRFIFLPKTEMHALLTVSALAIKDTLGTAQKTFMEWATRSGEKDARDLMDRLPAGSLHFWMTDYCPFSQAHKKYYRSSGADRAVSQAKKTGLDICSYRYQRTFPVLRSAHRGIDKYQLSLYIHRAMCVMSTKLIRRKEVRKFSQADRERFLIALMKVNFLKRLESSVHSFAITMERTVAKIEGLEGRLKAFKAHQKQSEEDVQPDFFIEPNEEDEELVEAFQVGAKLKFQMAHLNVDKWLIALAKDKQQLSRLANDAQAVMPSAMPSRGLRRSLKARFAPQHNTIGAQPQGIVFCALPSCIELYDELEDGE